MTLLVWLPIDQLHRMVLLSGLGDGKSSWGSANIDTCSGLSPFEKRKCQRRRSMANRSIYHGFSRRGRCLQRLTCGETTVGRRDFPGPTYRRVLRLSDHTVGHERPCPGQSSVHAVFGWRRMGQHGAFLFGWHHHPALVLPRARRGSAHVRGTQGRLSRSSLRYGVGDLLQRSSGLGDAHHVLLLPRQRGRRAELANGSSHHPGAVQLHWVHGRHHRLDGRFDPVVPGWHHYMCRCILAPNVGIRSRQGIPIFRLHRFRRLCVFGVRMFIIHTTSLLLDFLLNDFCSQVRPGWDIPINALLVVLGVSLLITALNFGSEVALNAIISLSNAALIFSYVASIGCIRLKRWRGQPLLPRRWTLGRFGGPVNDAALVFLLVSFVMSFFPVAPLPSVRDMNWAVLMLGVVIIAATVNYYASARHHYIAPVVLVKHE